MCIHTGFTIKKMILGNPLRLTILNLWLRYDCHNRTNNIFLLLQTTWIITVFCLFISSLELFQFYIFGSSWIEFVYDFKLLHKEKNEISDVDSELVIAFCKTNEFIAIENLFQFTNTTWFVDFFDFERKIEKKSYYQ